MREAKIIRIIKLQEQLQREIGELTIEEYGVLVERTLH